MAKNGQHNYKWRHDTYSLLKVRKQKVPQTLAKIEADKLTEKLIYKVNENFMFLEWATRQQKLKQGKTKNSTFIFLKRICQTHTTKQNQKIRFIPITKSLLATNETELECKKNKIQPIFAVTKNAG